MMSRKKSVKTYWEMTTAELRESTSVFDEEFVADRAKPLTPRMQARWQRAKAKSPPTEDVAGEEIISVSLEKTLLARCTALANKKRISRNILIARSLKALLAAEGEI